MAQPTRGALTSETRVDADWVPLTVFADTGGAPITSYRLEWDAGTGTWADVVGHTSSYLGTTYSITTGVVAGSSYRVRVSAYNAHGYGAYSPELTILAAAVPAKTSAPTTTISNQVDVTISWPAAYDSSAVVDEYQVDILTSDGTTYAEDTAYCGADKAAVVANLACTIPLSALRLAPFNLAQGALVRAKVRAHNVIGWGEYSDPSLEASAAAVQVEPQAMAAGQRGSATTPSQIEVTWTAPTGEATGGAAIDSMHLEWDYGSG
jgi:hypothetical protein